ncbi:hypothetical protein FV218_12470 [Methylobacterium sp. WL69]|uniref:hypothetical protein n=1 Tax=Methylobacterium sp. WL69 TaxID=2603893 RepID=UPI0011CACAAD|nr:hypothetical protein [Methylobacterium sp. WL69]TXM72814.1 hypothetical protein FV218_12470 [Methylobacterium sp. WL69]
MWFAEGQSAVRAVMGEVDIAVGRLRRCVAGLGVDDLTLRLITLTVWTDSAARSPEEKVAEVRRRLMLAAGA